MQVRPSPTASEQKHILDRLNAAEAFETFLQTKYVGQKRFSLEGGESLIPLLDAVLGAAADAGAGRGRHRHGRTAAGSTCWPTSSASRTRRSSPSSRATSTRGPAQGSGDVKYHLGSDRQVHDAATARTVDGLADRQPVAPGGRRPGARGHRPGQAGPHRPQGRGRLHRAAAADARRRRVRRPGRGRRDAQPVPAARLPHRRHRARGRQQPGRLHHRARSTSRSQPVLHRRGPDDPGADLPRQRRRPRGRACGWPGWPSSTGRRSTRTSSSTWSATAGAGTTRATTRR